MATEPMKRLTIVYSPHYDGEVYLGDAPKAMGTIYVGNMGLMAFLEQRAGIHYNIKSDVEREADYRNAITSFLTDKKEVDDVFFSGAVKVDPFGVARKLLKWRDSLIMAGWDGTCSDENCSKLVALSEIEQYFQSSGSADCWRKLYEEYHRRDVLHGMVEKIRYDSTQMDIPFLIKETLSAIFHQGEVQFESNCCQQDMDVSKIKLLEFHDVNDAYEWIAQIQELPEDTVIVNRDNIRLNHTFYTWNMPMVGATLMQSNPQLLQLFKLSMSIFSRPLNIHNLLSYLQLPMSPIPSGLRYKLAKILLRNGGFGEKKKRDDDECRDDWDEAIATYEFKNKEGKVTPQARAKKLSLLNPIRADYGDGLAKTEIVSYIKSILDWINGFNADDDLPQERKHQLTELKSLLQSLQTSLNSEKDVMTYADIEKLILQIYRPMNYQLQQAEKGSLNVIRDIRSMAKPAKALIWLDCQQEDVEADPYDFLSAEEHAYLASKGAVIPDFAQHLEYARFEKIYKLNQAEQVILVKSFYDGTTRLGEHSIVAEANYMSKKELPKVKPQELFPMKEAKKETGSIDVYQPELAYEIGPVNYKGRKESNTSIDTLINYPFNYVMDYVALLPTPDDDQLKNPHTTIGLVAHHFFQHVIEDSHHDLTEMRRLTEEEFDKRLETAIDVTGLILRLDENATALNNFRSHLRESMMALIDIMEKKELTPVGCEIDFPEKKEDALDLDEIGRFGARIDFVLKNKNDQYVIFDFKWSYSNRFAEKLKEDLSIQLELYRQSVMATYPDKTVAGVGYYMMPKKQLITTDFDEIADMSLIKHIDKPAVTVTLGKRIQHSYDFRIKEIQKGHIEEAETMDIYKVEDCYYTHQEDANKEMCPLAVEIKEEGKKNAKEIVSIIKKSEYIFRPSKKPSFDDNKKEPSETPTSHPVLKGRLK